MINAGLSAAAAMQSVYNAGTAAMTSGGSGFYGSAYVDITKLKSTTTSEYSQSIASNLQSGSDISLTSGNGDVNISGSNISSTNGNINLTAMLGNINITAGESTYSQSSKSNSQNLGGSVGSNGGSVNVGFSQSESTLDQTTYTNSQLTATNGSINLNSNKDTTVYGANLLASDINLTVGGDLIVKSRQNLLESDSYAIGASFGLSGNSSGVSGANAGFNTADSFQSRAWVDQLTSIIGTNSVTINTTNNTDITGAMIANITNASTATNSSDYIDGGNLTLNTGSLTYSDLKNYNNSESNSFSVSLQTGLKPNDPFAADKLKLNLSMQGSESSSDSKATIGQGTININGTSATEDQTANLNRDITQTEQNKKTVITSDFDAELTIPTMMLTNPTEFMNQVEQGAKITYKFTPMGVSELIESYTGQEMSWKPGDVARFKEKGREFETAVVGANTIGKANVIPTDPNDPKYDASRLWLIGQPLSSDPEGYKPPNSTYEGAGISNFANPINGMNSMSVFHDKFTQKTFLGTEGLLELSIIPAIPINYYGLIGKSIRNLYEEPKSNNSSVLKP